jgi:peptidoglycan hydrolase-like protein with peptidoglycan-binding domain
LGRHWSQRANFDTKIGNNSQKDIGAMGFTMKQLAVHSLGWSIGMIALAQLPVLASSPAHNTSQAASASLILEQIAQPPVIEQQLLAVALSSRSLRSGDNNADVRALQRYLSRNGLYPFAIDGVYQQETADAVATYQRIRNLPATGIADEETLRDMDFDFSPAAAPTPTATAAAPANRNVELAAGGLAPDSVGTDVIALQQRLNGLGIPVFVDGVYGFETEQAVRTYQRVQGLPVSGIADSDTLDSMGFTVPSYPYVAAIIADESELANVKKYFENAYMDRDRRGRFINIGSFAERFPAEARVDAAIARGFSTRVLYHR